MSQIAIGRDKFIFQLGADPTIPANIVSCNIIDVFHKKIFVSVSNNRRGRVVSFIYENAKLAQADPNTPVIHLRTWVMYLSQGTPATDWIGGNIEMALWSPTMNGGLKIEDNFLNVYEKDPIETPDYNNLSFEELRVGSTSYAPISMLKNQKVVCSRPDDAGPIVDGRLLVMYRPAIYYVGADYLTASHYTTFFYGIAYESYRLTEPGRAGSLGLITNPRIKEDFS